MLINKGFSLFFFVLFLSCEKEKIIFIDKEQEINDSLLLIIKVFEADDLSRPTSKGFYFDGRNNLYLNQKKIAFIASNGTIYDSKFNSGNLITLNNYELRFVSLANYLHRNGINGYSWSIICNSYLFTYNRENRTPDHIDEIRHICPKQKINKLQSNSFEILDSTSLFYLLKPIPIY